MNFKAPISTFTLKKNRRIVFSSLLAFSFFIVSFIAQAYFSYFEILQLAQSDNETKSILIEQSLNSIILKSDLVLLDVMTDLEKQKFTKHLKPDVYQEMLRKRFDLIPEMTALKIIDENGNYVGDAEGVLTKANLSDRSYFQAQKNNPKAGLLISEPIISKSINKWITVFSRRLNYSNGEFAGVVIATMSLDFFDRQYSHINKIPGAFVSIFRRSDNALIYRHPPQDNFLGKKVQRSEELKKLISQEKSSGIFESTSPIIGKRIITSYRLIGDNDIYILVGDEKDQVLLQWQNQIFVIAIFLTAICIGGGILLYRYLQSREEVEFQRAQAAHASKLSALGQMGAGIAHEINNPLTIIQGRLQIMKKKVINDNCSKESMLEFLDKTNEMVHRMSRIIKGLRNIARDGSSDPVENISLANIITDTLDLCQERLKISAVELRAADVPSVEIACRPTEIVQVLLNLINNGCDAVGELDPKWVQISYEVSGAGGKKEVIISVTDSGSGIPKEVLDKLMQPFFTTKDPNKGTGLGLSISNTIIKNHGGKLEYNSKSPNTRFEVTLPIIG